MPKVYRTANGKQVNMDSLLAANEKEIAIGNMGINARGDQLGPGGVIEKTKDKVMQDYYKLNTPIATDNPPQPKEPVNNKKELVDDWVEPTPEPVETKTRPMVRGSLASAVTETKADQDLVPKEPEPPKKKVSRF